MIRPILHTAVRPFKLTRAAIEAHRAHGPAPLLGCPICARNAWVRPVQLRWSSAPSA
jgi:hypothetical protein